MAEKYKIKNIRSKVVTEVSQKELETIQSNELVANKYAVISAPEIKPTKSTLETK